MIKSYISSCKAETNKMILEKILPQAKSFSPMTRLEMLEHYIELFNHYGEDFTVQSMKDMKEYWIKKNEDNLINKSYCHICSGKSPSCELYHKKKDTDVCYYRFVLDTDIEKQLNHDPVQTFPRHVEMILGNNYREEYKKCKQ